MANNIPAPKLDLTNDQQTTIFTLRANIHNASAAACQVVFNELQNLKDEYGNKNGELAYDIYLIVNSLQVLANDFAGETE